MKQLQDIKPKKNSCFNGSRTHDRARISITSRQHELGRFRSPKTKVFDKRSSECRFWKTDVFVFVWMGEEYDDIMQRLLIA